MAESDKSPKPKVELGTPVPAPKTQTEGKEQGKAGNAASGDSGAAGSAAAGFSRVSAWVGKTFPGHENAFWGGVLGLVAAVVVVAGIAVGQLVDGDPKLIRALQRLFSNNQ